MIENRWQDRFGAEEIGQLRDASGAVLTQLDVELPDYLPIGGQSESWRVDPSTARPAPKSGDDALPDLPLPALLSKVLCTFTIQFESKSDLSLALTANVIRVLHDQAVRVSQLTALTGVADIGVKNSLSLLEWHIGLTRWTCKALVTETPAE